MTCRTCGRPTQGRHWYCRKHRRKRNAAKMRRRRQRFLEEGRCTRCGHPRDTGGLTCSRCRQEQKSLQDRIPTATTTRYQLTLLQHRRKEGMCAYCGRERDDPAFKMCGNCRARGMARYYRDRAAWKLRAIKGGYNSMKEPIPLCPFCRSHHRRCDRCGKYMKPQHRAMFLIAGVGPSGRCRWTCTCGSIEVLPL